MTTPSSLEPLIAYFREQQRELAESHHGEFVLIHDKKVEGYYKEALEAYDEARQRGYVPGAFLIAECLTPEEQTPIVLHSRVA